MRKPPVKMSASATNILVTKTVTTTLQDHGNPINWMQLHKAMQVIMHDLKNQLGKWYSHEELFNAAIKTINQQIATDYRHGVTNLPKRFGWLRRKHNNVV